MHILVCVCVFVSVCVVTVFAREFNLKKTNSDFVFDVVCVCDNYCMLCCFFFHSLLLCACVQRRGERMKERMGKIL